MAVSARPRQWRWLRLVPLAIGAASLITGLWTGLARLGLALPGGVPALAAFHGALMISGFLGTLISLERAVALGRWWGYGAPALSALAAFALLAGAAELAAHAFLLASLALVVASLVVVVRQPALFTVMLTVAAACWGIGTLLWITGRGMPEITGWWLGFLVLTIAAERLELSRLLAPPPLSQAIFAAAALLLIIGVLRGEFAGQAAPLSGVGLLAVTAWLLRHDIALRTVRQTGQARFAAACVLGGHGWLGVAGLLLLLAPHTAFSQDAAVHAITLGFVFSMIFGHAPIVLPVVTGVHVRANAAAYAPLALLHISVLLRVVADLFAWSGLRTASGLVTLIALVGYAIALIAASRSKSPPASLR